ncbi:hypothetical protein SERLA73DRAFT_140487 [Serpula lacrymans var. lacrymans S7.3]|uniref:Uncharacterized protein n=2 Tax=Serpula lacrymans var. lacrymans TaxID=341189 RepID=F8Q5B4_SERL3|nr:uncharacterized protein SERLADRAFT_395455 [Serpula lacrymans var. lacrymans S7.9]EGN96741.1 hypothetical protein SERLA73DRAFT_140487 [Serpula lacrymans var. lacrymans S7.3]EGO22349.1 hypothetical protein SERLADRAFT_395455 [Serpula lacrymans var. lacrymans S7.9]
MVPSSWQEHTTPPSHLSVTKFLALSLPPKSSAFIPEQCGGEIELNNEDLKVFETLQKAQSSSQNASLLDADI